ncbi:MAG: PRTRC system protein C [Chloroflexi bacterium]|nr:PRTRC system protein C [Chloroflexota bacterium]
MTTQEATYTRRVFKYGDKTFPDPGAEYTAEQVLQHLRTYLPELGHAKTEEKMLDDGTPGNHLQ